MRGDGRLRLEELPPDLQGQVAQAAGVKGQEKHRTKSHRPESREEILRACVLVMAALNKSKLPPSSWRRVLGQCERWAHSPDRMRAEAKTGRVEGGPGG